MMADGIEIVIRGAQGTGKTWSAHKIAELLEAHGMVVHVDDEGSPPRRNNPVNVYIRTEQT